MSDTLYENQTTIDNHSYMSKNSRQLFEYFLVGAQGHSITSVKFSWDKAINANTIGTINIDLYAADGSNLPTGSSLMSGTFNGNTLAADPTYTTVEIVFGAPYSVVANTGYCMVTTAENTSGGNNVNVQDQESTDNRPAYAAGYRDYSGSYGAWTIFGTRDLYFLIYGIASSTNYTLTCAQGSYALTGQALGMTKALNMALAQGSYVLTGIALGLSVGHTIVLAMGSYVLTGIDLTMTKALNIALGQGSYSLTGQALTMTRGWYMALSTGYYTLTGFALIFYGWLKRVKPSRGVYTVRTKPSRGTWTPRTKPYR